MVAGIGIAEIEECGEEDIVSGKGVETMHASSLQGSFVFRVSCFVFRV